MSLILYPNPNHGRFSIDLKNPLQAGKNIITIFDMAGKNIYNGILPNQETTKQFDLSNIPSGIYILKVTGNEISSITEFNKN